MADITAQDKAQFRKLFPAIPDFANKGQFLDWLDQNPSIKADLAKAELHVDPWEYLAPDASAPSVAPPEAKQEKKSHGHTDHGGHDIEEHVEKKAPDEDTLLALEADDHYQNMVRHAVKDWNEQNPDQIIKDAFIKDKNGQTVMNPEILGDATTPGKIPGIREWAYNTYKEAYGQNSINAAAQKVHKNASEDPLYRKLLSDVEHSPLGKNAVIQNFIGKYPTKAYEYHIRRHLLFRKKDDHGLGALFEEEWKKYKEAKKTKEKEETNKAKALKDQRKKWDKEYGRVPFLRRKGAVHGDVQIFNNEVEAATQEELKKRKANGEHVDEAQIREGSRKKKVDELFRAKGDRAEYLMAHDKTLRKEHKDWEKKLRDDQKKSRPQAKGHLNALRRAGSIVKPASNEVVKDRLASQQAAQALGEKEPGFFAALLKGLGFDRTPNRISGMVFDEKGVRISGAILEVKNASGKTIKKITSASNGAYGISLPFGTFTLLVTFGGKTKQYTIRFKSLLREPKVVTLLVKIPINQEEEPAQPESEPGEEPAPPSEVPEPTASGPHEAVSEGEASGQAEQKEHQQPEHKKLPQQPEAPKQAPQGRLQRFRQRFTGEGSRISSMRERVSSFRGIPSRISGRTLLPPRVSSRLDSGLSGLRRNLGGRFGNPLQRLSNRLTNPTKALQNAAQSFLRRSLLSPQVIGILIALTFIFVIIVLVIAILLIFVGDDSRGKAEPTPTPSPTPSVAPQISITKDGPETGKLNNELTYTLAVTYSGSGDVTVTDTLHGKATFVKADPAPKESDINTNADGTLRSVTWNVATSTTTTSATADCLLGDPTGSVSNGGKWEDVNRWDKDIITAADRVEKEQGVRPPESRIKAHIMLESQGNPNAHQTDNPRGTDYEGLGLMQITPLASVVGAGLIPKSEVKEGGAVMDPATNIYLGASELYYKYKDQGSWEKASASYLGLCDLKTGICPGQYANDINDYITTIEHASCRSDNQGAIPAPPSGNSNLTITLTVKPIENDSYLYNSAFATLGTSSFGGNPTTPPSTQPPPSDITELKNKLCNDYNVCPTVSTQSPPSGDWTKDSLTALWNVVQKMASSKTYMKYAIGDKKLEISRVHDHPNAGGWAYGVNINEQTPEYHTLKGSRLIVITDRAFESFGGNPSVPYLEWLLAHEIGHAASYGKGDGTNGTEPGNDVYNAVLNCHDVVSQYGRDYGSDENYADSVSFYLTDGEEVVNYYGDKYNLKEDFPCTYNALKTGYFDNKEF